MEGTIEIPDYRPTITDVISGFNLMEMEVNQIVEKYEKNNVKDCKNDNEQWLSAGKIWFLKLWL